MSLFVFFLALLACVVVMGISLWFIRQQLKASQLRAERIQAGEARYREERQKAVDSIRVLLKVAGTDEVNWIEASIRIKNLLDKLSLDLSEHKEISVFYLVTEKTEHIPTHEQWRSLPKQAKNKFQKEMDGYEKAHVEDLKKAKVSLLAFDFSE
ncbi:DUF2489 domain-containing protein [Marinomonas posidonica]|uniref:DUF2489 domain-containing protein n=1 Tax=Marinomonas posidonica (strain CECT 7376 / NCIMB 14433 / IVIA-Po-181) TaxID=491952 RepID=F6D0C6_MARPP|nr:DUF2489 domain-containing protein [Marinomonas posidonica]AEF53648.1 Domain of unknown function DUF2489-containing protein [Marinomonas posidonica IVIA-Po-181]